MDPEQNKVPSVLLTPIWVTPDNIESTVVKDKFVDAGAVVHGESGTCTKTGVR